jgi:hypothetical protein
MLGEEGTAQPINTACTHGTQINFGDLTLYLPITRLDGHYNPLRIYHCIFVGQRSLLRIYHCVYFSYFVLYIVLSDQQGDILVQTWIKYLTICNSTDNKHKLDQFIVKATLCSFGNRLKRRRLWLYKNAHCTLMYNMHSNSRFKDNRKCEQRGSVWWQMFDTVAIDVYLPFEHAVFV